MAPRAIWSGALSFGLVNVPVKLYPATRSKDVRFNQLHAKDGARIRQKRVSSVTGEEVGPRGDREGLRDLAGHLRDDHAGGARRDRTEGVAR